MIDTYQGWEVGSPVDTDIFDVADIKMLFTIVPLHSLSVKFQHPNRNTLEYVYIDGTWQNLQRTVIPREHFYLRFFDYDTVTINITAPERSEEIP
jgi:hypothetical protein